jgi:hypothetical protein
LTLLIENDSPAWIKVRGYCNARVDELTAQCVGLGATDSERRDAAARIDELRLLLAAPTAAHRSLAAQVENVLRSY